MFHIRLPIKGKSTNSAVPNFSRPLDGSEQYPSGPSFAARPIKHWRKQLVTVNNSSRARPGIGMPMDLPGGSVYLGDTEENTDCTKCLDYLTGSDEFSQGAETTGLKDNILRTNTIDPTSNLIYDCVNNKPVCIACNPENNIIKPATTVLSKKYYTDTRSYLKSRCVTYDQKLSTNPVPGVEYFSADGQPLYPDDSLLGPQVRATQNCFKNCNICSKCSVCPTCNIAGTVCSNVSSCLNFGNNTTCYTTPSITIYKPNNRQFAVQGAVSSGARIDRLKYNTITTNGGSFYTAWGAAGANAGRYQGTTNGPYFLKNKVNICQPQQYHKNGNKRICEPQPYN
jgi:hypothetical protein